MNGKTHRKKLLLLAEEC
ncbi:hypothetical protein Gorai_015645, partial [Gossypium raimondii]|nr:hypothetical protein [Gossypium raimondii]